mmetsp:Transcript_15570/g.40254  ORF Transcript_15570/g.40254 Transcript_15570/m.40254 type:complete len:82 (-) Transcript_15570:37-282(-)
MGAHSLVSDQKQESARKASRTEHARHTRDTVLGMLHEEAMRESHAGELCRGQCRHLRAIELPASTSDARRAKGGVEINPLT